MNEATPAPAELVPESPYWADTYDEVAPHVFKRKDNQGLVVSAERTWTHLRHNNQKLAAHKKVGNG